MTDEEMFECLREWRMEVAKRKGKKAFEILGNGVLMGIVKARPRAWGELLAIKGMGPSKMGQYSKAILSFMVDLEGPPAKAEARLDRELLIKALTEFRRENSGPRMPAFMLYTDAAMNAIVEAMPSTLEKLYEVKGVRRDFVIKHGERFLSLLQEERKP